MVVSMSNNNLCNDDIWFLNIHFVSFFVVSLVNKLFFNLLVSTSLLAVFLNVADQHAAIRRQIKSFQLHFYWISQLIQSKAMLSIYISKNLSSSCIKFFILLCIFLLFWVENPTFQRSVTNIYIQTFDFYFIPIKRIIMKNAISKKRFFFLWQFLLLYNVKYIFSFII